MCTAVSYKTKDHYFGRNLDLEFSYKETVTITPRNFVLQFRMEKELKEHYAIIGMAYVKNNYPLYYDATNEKGLSIAGLNFPGYAAYYPKADNMENITPFELIPWILGKCADVKEARKLLETTNLLNINYSDELPLSPLHWIISDKHQSITVESMKDGLKVYDNPVGVLTNNPPYDMQMFQLNNYRGLSNKDTENTFAKGLELELYSRGMGALGLPGDLSSTSRFVKAVFTKMNSVSGESEEESVSQMFHILGSVEQQRGCVIVTDHETSSNTCEIKEDNRNIRDEILFNKDDEMKYEITIYTSCCNTDKGIYYYTTYDNRQIIGVDMHKENLDGSELIQYSLIMEQQIKFQN